MRRRWLLIGGAVVGSVLILAAAGAVLLFAQIGSWAVRAKVIPAVSRKLGRRVTAGRIQVDRHRVVLRDVAIRGPRDRSGAPLAHIDRVVATYDLWDAVLGDARPGRVEIDGLDVTAVRRRDGSDNFSDILKRFRGRKRRGGGGGHRSRSLRPKSLLVRDASFDYRDDARGITALAGHVDARVDVRGKLSVDLGSLAAVSRVWPTVSARRIEVTADLRHPIESAHVAVKGGRVSLWTGMALTGISGTLARGKAPGTLAIDLSGGYGGAGAKLWTARGWVNPRTQDGRLRLGADRFTLARLRPVLAHSVVIDYDHTSISGELVVKSRAGRVGVSGSFSVSGLNVYHPMLAAKPVRNINLNGTVSGVIDRHARIFTLSDMEISSGGVEYHIDGQLRLPGGIDPETGARRTRPRVMGHFRVDPVSCETMLRSIPGQLVPHLQGFVLRGTFQTDLRVDIDWANLDATVLGGSVGINGCQVVKAPAQMSAKRLKAPFEDRIQVEKNKWISVTIGPENPNFVPLAQISPYLVNSIMTTEDSRFYYHHGFITSEFRADLIKDLKAGYFKYGASSITMQMVKNVLLYREKTLSRKLQELFLTWYVERKLDKNRIMEIYLNAIEFGPGIYGIGPAAQRYFGEAASEITPVQAAFFSSILPAPKRRYRQYCRGQPASWTLRKIGRILDYMHQRGRLTDLEYVRAKIMPLTFDTSARGSEKKCMQVVKQAIANAPPTSAIEAAAEAADEQDPNRP